MDREDVKQALLKAYEAGWRGSLELKEEYAEDAVFCLLGSEEKEEEKKEQQISWTVGGAASDQSGQAWSYNTFSDNMDRRRDFVSVSSEWVADRSNWSNNTVEIVPNVEIPEVPAPEETPLSDSFDPNLPEILVPVDLPDPEPEEDPPLDGWDDD